MLQELESPPKSSDPFLWADFIELRAVIHPDKCFSRGDLDGVRKRAPIKFDPAERWEWARSFQGIRQIDLGADYPFVISPDGDTISFEFHDNAAERLYTGLLIASCMRHLEDTSRSRVTGAFELISKEVFKSLMPPGATVKGTYASGGDYKGTLFEKMQLIAADLRCTANFKPRDFKTNDRGDGGIDLVGWHDMYDEREGMPIAFAQCGCSKEDWTFKQLEASPAKHYIHLPVMHPWATYYFLPLDLRDTDRDWAKKNDIGQAIIVDRMRLMKLSKANNLYANMPEMTFVDDVIKEDYS